MNRLRRGIALVITAALATVGFAATATSASADTDPIDATFSSASTSGINVPWTNDAGHGAVYTNARVMTLVLDDGSKIDVYCTNWLAQGTIPDGQAYTAADWTEHTVPGATPGKMRWVLANGYPAVSVTDLAARSGVTGLTVAEAISATQFATWYAQGEGAGDGYPRPDQITTEGSLGRVRALYEWLVANAADTPDPGSVADPYVTISPREINGTVGDRIGPFVIDSNAKVTLSAANAEVIEENGSIYLDTSESIAGEISLRADVTATIITGSLFIPVGSSNTSNLQELGVARTIALTANDQIKGALTTLPVSVSITGSGCPDGATKPEPTIFTIVNPTQGVDYELWYPEAPGEQGFATFTANDDGILTVELDLAPGAYTYTVKGSDGFNKTVDVTVGKCGPEEPTPSPTNTPTTPAPSPSSASPTCPPPGATPQPGDKPASECATTPPTIAQTPPAQGGVLAHTGAQIGLAALCAIILIGGGTAIVVIRRRNA